MENLDNNLNSDAQDTLINKNFITTFWNRHTLLCIIIIAFIPRLIASIFSQGYGMHDDHFGPIEQSWQVINDYKVWENRGEPYGHSLAYPGMHYYIFKILNASNIHDQKDQMFIIRLYHALFSLLVVFFGYKITEIISNKKNATLVGILLALLWILPFLSVRNLIEVFCIPPLMAGFYFIVYKKECKWKWFVSGAMFAFAFSFRYQTLILPATIAFILFVSGVFKPKSDLGKNGVANSVFLLIGLFVTALLFQGTIDYLAWGYPFASFKYYLLYNMSHGEDYTTGPWYQYLLLIFGILIPPLSVLLLYGFGRTWKKYLILFLPTFMFFAMHSYFPNKQERFIAPILPMVIVLSVIGWQEFLSISKYWQKHKTLLKSFWIWFWIANTLLLIMLSFTYSKKSRVESFYYLSKKNDVQGVAILSGKLGTFKPPCYYLDKYWTPVYEMKEEYNGDSLTSVYRLQKKALPNYIIFYDLENLDKRITKYQTEFRTKLVLDKIIEPSLIDDVLCKLNPKHNKNQTAYIYKSYKY